LIRLAKKQRYSKHVCDQLSNRRGSESLTRMWVRHSRQTTRNNFFGTGEGVSGAVKRPSRCLLTQPSEYRAARQQGLPRHPPLTSAVHRNFTHSTPGPHESGKTPSQRSNSPASFSVERYCGSTLTMLCTEIIQGYFSIALTDNAFGRSVDGATPTAP
jgi:hypothetical protein